MVASRRGAQALEQAQWLWLMGSVAPRHVGSSQPRDGPTSPPLAGGFFTTEPPGKSHLGHTTPFKIKPNTILLSLTAKKY